MNDEVINAIEDEFYTQFKLINWDGRIRREQHKEFWWQQNRDCVRSMAKVVKRFRPDYSLLKFYQNCGYQAPYPEEL